MHKEGNNAFPGRYQKLKLHNLIRIIMAIKDPGIECKVIWTFKSLIESASRDNFPSNFFKTDFHMELLCGLPKLIQRFFDQDPLSSEYRNLSNNADGKPKIVGAVAGSSNQFGVSLESKNSSPILLTARLDRRRFGKDIGASSRGRIRLIGRLSFF